MACIWPCFFSSSSSSPSVYLELPGRTGHICCGIGRSFGRCECCHCYWNSQHPGRCMRGHANFLRDGVKKEGIFLGHAIRNDRTTRGIAGMAHFTKRYHSCSIRNSVWSRGGNDGVHLFEGVDSNCTSVWSWWSSYFSLYDPWNDGHGGFTCFIPVLTSLPFFPCSVLLFCFFHFLLHHS